MLMKYRLITFDIFNTIIRVRGSPGHHYARAANSQGIKVESAKLNSVYSCTWKDHKKALPIYGVNQGMTSADWWHTFITTLFREAGYDVEPEPMSKLTHFLYDDFVKPEYWEILPHSEMMLDKFKQNNVLLGVVSNFDERLQTVLEELQLDKYFDFLVTSAMVRSEKPDPRMFKVALQTAGVSADQAAHVGDDLFADFWAARKVGMHSYLLNWSKKYSAFDLNGLDPHYMIDDIIGMDRLCCSPEEQVIQAE